MDARPDISRLESLLESARVLSSSLDLDAQLSHLVRTVMGRLLVTRCAVALGGPGELRVAIARGVRGLNPGDAFDALRAAEFGLASVRPLGGAEPPLGVIALGRPAAGALGPGEEEFLAALLDLAGAAVSNARAHEEVLRSNLALGQKIQELRAILDLVGALASSTEPEEIARFLMLTLSGRWAVTRHAIATWKEGQPAVLRVKGLAAAEPTAWRAALEDQAEPVAQGELFLLPITTASSMVGAVALGPRPGGIPYTPADVELARGLIAQASVALENAWRFRDTLFRRQLEQELTLAASIQKDLFPKSLPALPSTELVARNRQAREVGGDYYDVIPYEDGALQLLCVADISGKGLSAALLMASIQATLRALAAGHSDLPTIAARSSDLLWASTPSNKYATVFLALYDPASGAIEYVNAGHAEGVLLRASGPVELLDSTGMPVGMLPRRTYSSGTTCLEPGDLLFLYSDGVTDASQADDSQFGLDNAIECLRRHASQPLETICDRLYEAIDAFAAGTSQFDDITVMLLRRTG